MCCKLDRKKEITCYNHLLSKNINAFSILHNINSFTTNIQNTIYVTAHVHTVLKLATKLSIDKSTTPKQSTTSNRVIPFYFVGIL